jgi:hypothetical protein
VIWAVVAGKEQIGPDHEPARSELGQVGEDLIEVTFSARLQDPKLHPKLMGRLLQVLHSMLAMNSASASCPTVRSARVF